MRHLRIRCRPRNHKRFPRFKFFPEGLLDNAFTTAVARKVKVLIVQNDALFSSRPDQLAELAMQHRLPTIFENHEDAAAGGLISYGPSWKERYRVLGSYAGRILKGEKPADLPVQA